MPQNIFNYNGDDTYTFDPALSNPAAGRAIFNFEFAVNSDADGASARNVDAIIWLLTVDIDPGWGVSNAFSSDFINVAFADHSFGTNGTANGAGVEAANVAAYAGLIANNNVAQNSSNLGFGFTPNPQLPGVYTFTLSGSDSTGVLASTSINVIVGQVPEPASLSLAALALGMVGRVRARRKSAV